MNKTNRGLSWCRSSRGVSKIAHKCQLRHLNFACVDVSCCPWTGLQDRTVAPSSSTARECCGRAAFAPRLSWRSWCTSSASSQPGIHVSINQSQFARTTSLLGKEPQPTLWEISLVFSAELSIMPHDELLFEPEKQSVAQQPLGSLVLEALAHSKSLIPDTLSGADMSGAPPPPRAWSFLKSCCEIFAA